MSENLSIIFLMIQKNNLNLQIIHVYDWINRDIPSREDLEAALNTLLFLNFITMQDDKFTVSKNIENDFDKYNEKNMRKSEFESVRMYFKQ